jgi:hypothetical protein
MIASSAQIQEARHILSDEEANELALELFGAADVEEYTYEADALASVVMKIINLFVYEESMSNRESNMNFLSCAIYARTRDFCDRMEQFSKSAGVREG